MIGILSFNMGNIASVANAIYEQGFDFKLVSAAADFEALSHLIIPGVGHFAEAMKQMSSLGLIEPLQQIVMEEKVPTLGICLGMQLLASHSEEGFCGGLDFIAGDVKEFKRPGMRVPHVGWNSVHIEKAHPVLAGINDNRDFYFVHSYHFCCEKVEHVLGITDYGGDFHSIVAMDNIVGAQFHPEKSQGSGLKFLENFCNWDGRC